MDGVAKLAKENALSGGGGEPDKEAAAAAE